jgi:two-component system cell cycle response regulator CpdR
MDTCAASWCQYGLGLSTGSVVGANFYPIHSIFTSFSRNSITKSPGPHAAPGRLPNETDRPAMDSLMNRILLAEDDNDMRRFLAKALQNAGYDVVAFDNGRSAYERIREEPFTLLLTDIVMPEMDGIELARRATELDPDLKVMFITGFAAVALNPDSNAPKDAKVLSKPFHLRDLVNEVERLLAA